MINGGRETKGVREGERQTETERDRKEKIMRGTPRQRDCPRMESILPSEGTENIWEAGLARRGSR